MPTTLVTGLAGGWWGWFAHSVPVKRHIPAAVAALAVSLLLTACSPSVETTPTPEPTPTAVALGFEESVSGDGWDVTVHSVTRDDEAIQSANEFNPRASDGTHYLLVNMTITRTGVPAVPWDITIVGPAGVSPAAVVAPDQLHLLDEWGNGHTVTGNIIFEVPDGTDGQPFEITVGRGPARALTPPS